MAKKLTKEEIEILSKLDCVTKISENHNTFTKQFKVDFIQRAKHGESCREILESHGIKWDYLGKRRVYSMYRRWKVQIDRPEGFDRKPNSTKGQNRKKEFKSVEEEMQYLKDEKDYYKRLSEWLKKPGGRKEPTRK